MSELPQVGQTYKHKTHGDVSVVEVRKRGRGHYVSFEYGSPPIPDGWDGEMIPMPRGRDRLKDWQKATA